MNNQLKGKNNDELKKIMKKIINLKYTTFEQAQSIIDIEKLFISRGLGINGEKDEQF